MRTGLVSAVLTVFSLLLFSTICFHASPIYAQSSGATTGTILINTQDSQGAAIAGAQITVRQMATGATRTTTSGEDGSVSILQLPPGDYEVKIDSPGFSSRLERFYLGVGTTALLKGTLMAAATSEVIEVKASDSNSLVVKTESSTNIEPDRITNLPINVRDFLGFSFTVARVTMDRVSPESTLATSGLSFNGQSARFNNITIDGLDNNELSTGTARSTFSQEAVQEFQVVSDSYSAEFGRSTGGIINIVTKSGGNQFHSTLFYFLRNDSLSARDVFSPTKLPYRQNQAGITLSGPIKSDRAYFFTAFERRTIRQNNLVTIADATVAAARRENFSLSNGAVPIANGLTSLLARGDFQLSSNDNLWVRYNGGFIYDGAFEPFGSLKADTNGGIQRLDDNSIAINNTYINPNLNLINETRFLFNRFDQTVDPISNQAQISLAVPEGNVFFGTNRVLPQVRLLDTYQFVNNVSLLRGRHQIKFGIDIIYRKITANSPIFNTGFSIFLPIDFAALSGIPTLPSFTALEAFDPSLRSPQQRAFLQILAGTLPQQIPGFPANLPLDRLGLPSAYVQGFGGRPLANKTKLYSGFIQDDFQLKPNLLLKAGLRYDLGRYDALPKNNGHISPRLAFTYRPGNSEKFNLRAAYGIFFAPQLTGPGLASQFFSTGSLKILVAPFPTAIIPYSLPDHQFPISDQLPTGVPGVNFIPQLSQNLIVQPDLSESYTQQATAGFDYFINNQTGLSVNYTFVRGLKLFSVRMINPVVRPVPGNSLQSSLTGRVDPTQGDVFEFESAFDSYYHGVTLTFERRLTGRFSLLAHYTLSKTIDNYVDFRGDFQEAEDPLRPGNERGLSLQDVRNRAVISGLWNINYSRNALLKDFQLSTIITLESGRPYNLLAGVDLNRNGDNPPGDRPLGLGRNSGVTKGFTSFDLRLQRIIKIGERVKLQAMIEAFNLFNRVNFNTNSETTNRTFLPDAQGRFTLPAKDGGKFTLPQDRYRGAFAPRQFQIGLRLTF